MKQDGKMIKGLFTTVSTSSVSCSFSKNTALHFAAREGHAKAVALLLKYDASIVLNKQQASFLHVALHNKRKEVVLTTIRNKRYTHCLPAHCHLVPSDVREKSQPGYLYNGISENWWQVKW